MLFVSKLKHEIGRAAFLIAFHLLVKPLDRHSVKFGDVGIEDLAEREETRCATPRKRLASRGVSAS